MYFDMPTAYGATSKDDSIRSKSRSGGMFTIISDYILERRGVVFGCRLNDEFEAVHTACTSKKERDALCGSKYVQSSMDNCFRLAKQYLDEDIFVLFSGTSCQIKGLKNYLGKDYKKLLLVDILCHGVPSPAIWHDYLKWQMAQHEVNVKKVSFRNKTDFGWKSHIETIYFEDGTRVDSHLFTDLFYEHNILRPCCYECKFKKFIHPGDITLGDFWEIINIDPEYNDNKGLSLVLLNTQKGADVFNSIKDRINFKKYEAVKTFRKSMLNPFPCPPGRKMFWEKYLSNGFEACVKNEKR